MSATADHAQNPADDGGHHDAHGDDSHGDHHDPNLAHHFDSMEQQFESGKLGMWVFLATEILMFGGLFCAYAIYRGNNPDIFLFAHQALNTEMGAINTAVLLASSFTMAVGVKAASEGRNTLLFAMLVVTFLGGVGFMTIKSMEYVEKYDHGLFPGTWNAFYTTDAGFESADAKAEQESHTIEYIEKKHDKAGHGGGHGEGHSGGHAEDHGAGHAEPHGNPVPQNADDMRDSDETELPGTPAGEGTSPLTAAHGDNASSPQPEVPTTVDHTTEASIDGTPPPAAGGGEVTAAAPSPGSSAWPPVPADHMALTAPVNLAPQVNEAYLAPAPRVGPVEGLVVGGSKLQAAETAGPKYPGFANLSPLDQERTHIFFQIYFVMTGLHGLHVLIGMGLIFWVGVATLKYGFGPSYYAPVDIVGLYWHLVDLIWIFLFPLLYLIH